MLDYVFLCQEPPSSGNQLDSSHLAANFGLLDTLVCALVSYLGKVFTVDFKFVNMQLFGSMSVYNA